MSDRFDQELRERFVALRDEDAGRAPSLAQLVRRKAAGSRPLAGRLLPVGILVATAVVTAAVLVRAPRDVSTSADEAIAQAQSLSAWTAPSDAWLRLSGLEIPNSVPSLSPSSVPLPQAVTATTASGELR
jgi:hypothetical protein